MVALALTRVLPRLLLATARTATPRLVVSNIGITGNVPSLARTLAAAATRKTTAKKTTTAKKAPAKKKPVAKKAAPKKKPAAKKAAPKKKVAAKKVAAKKPRKVLTEEEKTERAFAKKVKEVKQLALPRQPPSRSLSVFNTYVTLQMSASDNKMKLAEVAQTFKGLTVQEVQVWNLLKLP